MTFLTVDPHIRPIRLNQDIPPVADLVELCFAEHMDAEGRSYLNNVRLAGRSISSEHLGALTPETTSIPFHGYVWVENGRILGNVTLIHFKRNQQRYYFIANVSVHPDFRGRGIARQLTARSLQHVKEKGGKSVFLQVREDNPAAIHLYQSLGFTEIMRRTNWTVDVDFKGQIHPPENIQVTRRMESDWELQKSWLREIYPEKVPWFIPFNIDKLEPGLTTWLDQWLNSGVVKCWAVRSSERTIGFASLEKINPQLVYLWLATSPAFEDEAISTLLAYLLKRVRNSRKIQINYPAHRGENAFKGSGMKELHTLLWMEKKITFFSE